MLVVLQCFVPDTGQVMNSQRTDIWQRHSLFTFVYLSLTKKLQSILESFLLLQVKRFPRKLCLPLTVSFMLQAVSIGVKRCLDLPQNSGLLSRGTRPGFGSGIMLLHLERK